MIYSNFKAPIKTPDMEHGWCIQWWSLLPHKKLPALLLSQLCLYIYNAKCIAGIKTIAGTAIKAQASRFIFWILFRMFHIAVILISYGHNPCNVLAMEVFIKSYINWFLHFFSTYNLFKMSTLVENQLINTNTSTYIYTHKSTTTLVTA